MRLLSDGTVLHPRLEMQKDVTSKTHDDLGALICALVAYLSTFGGAERCLPVNGTEETIIIESAALGPSTDWQARLLMRKS